jgi:prophage antirepressor-like protein
MNELTLFNNPDFGEIRTLETNDGKVLFCGKDVATALGYKETAKAIREHCKGVSEIDTPTKGGIQKMKFITESDIYRLTFSSKLPDAEKFTDWITEEVIPSIMRTGSYSMNGKPKPTNPNTEKRLAIQEMNAKTRQAKLLLDFAKLNLSAESKTLLANEAGRIITGKQILPLPETERTYSAGEVGEMLGISANKVGRLANAHGLKIDTYGITVLDTAPNGKQIPTFRYNQHGIDKLKELLKN